jgi:protein SCO1/2
MYAIFTFTLVLNKANAAQNIKINSDFELFDQNNKKIKKFNLLGSPTVLFFGFTYCPDVCPTTLQSLSVLIDKLGKDKNKIKFYFVSIDPERDTPAVLKDYLSSFNPKINALTGKQKDLDVLIKSFSIYAKKVPLDNNNYTMDHTASLILIDKNTSFVGTITYEEKNKVALEKLQKLIKN